MGIFKRGSCGQCSCTRFRGAMVFPHVPSPYEQSLGMVVPDSLDGHRDYAVCECDHYIAGHADPWISRPLLRLWPGGPVLITRWAIILVPVSLALASVIVVTHNQGGHAVAVPAHTLHLVQAIIIIGLSGFASPPIRKIYGLLTVFFRIAIILFVAYVIALLGVQQHWWHPISLGFFHVG